MMLNIALLVNRNEEADDTVTIAGKLCESGDIIIKKLSYPPLLSVETI